jgi:very-short-patch-repair endonuclease
MKFGDEVRNARFSGTIPDVRSKRYRYIIEIDGKIHADPEVRKNDMRKTALWNRQGYRVFRIMAGDKEKLRKVASKIRQLRKLEPVLSDALRRIYEI